MATIPRRNRASGGSLVLAVAFRFLWLPVFAGAAIALVTGSRGAGAVGGCWWLLVELATYRWRWAWRRLDRLPRIDEPPPDLEDVRLLARSYGVGVVLFCAGLAVWQVIAGAGLDHVGRSSGIFLGTAAIAAGYVILEYLMRPTRTSQFKPSFGGDDAFEVGELGLLVMLLPRRWWRGATTLIAIGLTTLLGGGFGLSLVGGGKDAMWTNPTFAFLIVPGGTALCILAAAVVAGIEAKNATWFVEAYAPSADPPPSEPTSA